MAKWTQYHENQSSLASFSPNNTLQNSISADAGPVPTSLYQRAERCVNRLGYEWAALKWEESQVEVRALGALKEAVLGRRAEDDVMRAVNLVR